MTSLTRTDAGALVFRATATADVPVPSGCRRAGRARRARARLRTRACPSPPRRPPRSPRACTYAPEKTSHPEPSCSSPPRHGEFVSAGIERLTHRTGASRASASLLSRGLSPIGRPFAARLSQVQKSWILSFFRNSYIYSDIASPRGRKARRRVGIGSVTRSRRCHRRRGDESTTAREERRLAAGHRVTTREAAHRSQPP